MFDEIMTILRWLREKRGDVEDFEDQAFQSMLAELNIRVELEIQEKPEIGNGSIENGPYAALYVMYLMAMCDLRNHDFESFKVSYQMFMDYWNDYATYYQKHRDFFESQTA